MADVRSCDLEETPRLVLVDSRVLPDLNPHFSLLSSTLFTLFAPFNQKSSSKEEDLTDSNSMDSPVDRIPTFADLANLSADKYQHLESTLSFILASPAAQDTYAQLIDGRPTWQSYVRDSGFPDEVTIVSDHPTPSDKAIQQYEEIRTALTLHAIKMDVNVQLLHRLE